MILKPDKGQGVVLIKKSDSKQSMERLFLDQRKVKVLTEDPTTRSLTAVQNYLNTLYNSGETTELKKKEMRPKFAQVGSTSGLVPIVDTTNTPYYGIGKYLSCLLNLLTHNYYSVKGIFQVANKIRSIPPELFEQGYRYYSLDGVSLFTNVP